MVLKKDYFFWWGLAWLVVLICDRAVWRDLALYNIRMGYWEFHPVCEMIEWVCLAIALLIYILGHYWEE
jgi:hypothetical protein